MRAAAGTRLGLTRPVPSLRSELIDRLIKSYDQESPAVNRRGDEAADRRGGPRDPEEGRFHRRHLACIARAGRFNQALIFYHFGNLEGLLLAALDHTSDERLERYRNAIAEAASVDELVAAVARLYAEDRARPHDRRRPDGRRKRSAAGAEGRVGREMEPWIELRGHALDKGFAWLGLPELVPHRELAYAFVTFYLGVNLTTQLDEDRKAHRRALRPARDPRPAPGFN